MLTVLTIEHLPLFLELKENNPGQWKLDEKFFPLSQQADFFIDTLCSNNSYTIGWIQHNQLLSVTSLYQYADTPSWCWMYYAVTQGNYKNFQKVGGDIIINEMFVEASRRNLSTCVMLVRDNFPTIISEAVGKMKDKITSWHNLIPEIKKYEWVDELKIPAGTTAKYPYVNNLMFNQTWPIDLRLRLGYLKQEHRKL